MAVAAMKVDSGIPDARKHPRLTALEVKRRELLDGLATVENTMRGGPALRERLEALEADAMIGKPVERELEKVRAAVRELTEAEQKAGVLHRALRNLEKERIEVERAVHAELAKLAVEGVYTGAVRDLAAHLLSTRESAIRLYALAGEIEQKFGVSSGCGPRVRLPGYGAESLMGLSKTWHRLLAAQYSELRGWLRDSHDAGLLREEDLGGVYTPRRVAPRPTGTVVLKGVRINSGALANRKEVEVDVPHIRPDAGGELLRVDGTTVEVWSPIGRISPRELRVGERVEYVLSTNGRGEHVLNSVHQLPAQG
jgi:hypothetical protein